MTQARRFVAASVAVLALLQMGASVEQVPPGKVFRPIVRGLHGAVAAGNPLTVEAGLRVLRSGGNAVDAGVAATASRTSSARSSKGSVSPATTGCASSPATT